MPSIHLPSSKVKIGLRCAVFAATTVVTLYVIVKVLSTYRACVSLATSCQRCLHSGASMLKTRAVLGFLCGSVKNRSSARGHLPYWILITRALLGLMCVNVKYPGSAREHCLRPTARMIKYYIAMNFSSIYTRNSALSCKCVCISASVHEKLIPGTSFSVNLMKFNRAFSRI